MKAELTGILVKMLTKHCAVDWQLKAGSWEIFAMLDFYKVDVPLDWRKRTGIPDSRHKMVGWR